MVCELCGGKTTVNVTYADCDVIIRHRRCIDCGHMFFTQEIDMTYEDAKLLISNIRKEQRNGK